MVRFVRHHETSYLRMCFGLSNLSLMKKLEYPPFNKYYLLPIYKHNGVAHLSDFRPISLCNKIYKIISKFLVRRHKMVLPKCLGKELREDK